MASGQDVGYYTLPVILSFDGVEQQANKKLSKVFGDASKTSSKALGSGAKAAAADVDKLAAAYSKLRDKADDALGKVRVEETKLKALRDAGKGSSAAAVAAEERLATARRKSAAASKEADSSHRSLSAAQSALSGSTDNLGRKFGGMSDLAGKAGTAIAGAGVIAAGAAVVGIGALVVGVAAAGRALYDLGAEFDDVFDNIRVKTGATGPQLDALAQATERLSTKVPLSIGEIGNVVAETSRALHLTGTDLDNTSKAVANLGRLTGEPVNIRALGKAFRGFGVDAKDQVPALDGLLRATQTTGVGVNELLDTVVKGGAGLRQFGFDFGESAALATQFEEAGLDADKAMGGLTKGLAGLAKDGKTGQQALSDTVGSIKDLLKQGNDAAALDLTNKLFGAKGGVQFFEAIKNGALDLDTLASSMANTGDTIANAAADTDDWAERWQIFKNEIAVGLQPIGTAVFDGINGKLTELADWVSTHKAEVIQFFGDLASTIVEKTSQALHGISLFISQGIVPLLRTIEDFGKNNILADFIPGAKDAGTAAGLLADGFSQLPGALDEAAGTLKGLVPQIDILTDRTVNAQKFTTAIGDATAAISAVDGQTIEISDNTPEVAEGLKTLGLQVTTLPNGKFTVTANTDEGARILQAFRDQQNKTPLMLGSVTIGPGAMQSALNDAASKSTLTIGNVAIPGLPRPPANAPLFGPLVGPPKAAGGAMLGPGPKGVDSILFAGAPGEHVMTAPEVDMLGGQKGAYALRGMIRSGAITGHAGGGEVGVSSGAAELKGILAQTFPGISAINADTGRRDGPGEHASGNALDVMLGSDYKSPGKISLGNQIAQFALDNASLLGLKWVIWNDKIYKPGQPGEPYGNPGSSDDNNQHRNHVHVFLAGKGVKAPAFDAGSLIGGSGGAGGSSSLMGGYGGSGGSTAGIGPNGEAGTYEAPDPKAIREADEKVADADARVKQAELKIKELDADAKESQKQAAQADLDKSKREAADARTDAQSARQGKFTAGGAGGKSGGGPQLSELGSIAKSFVTETFGLDGSWLPDIGNLAPLKMADTLLSAFMPAGGSGGPGASTSGASFGMADLAAPAMPDGTNHLGPNAGGLPGPTINLDASQTVQGGIGIDPDQVERNRLRALDRGKAMLSGIPMGVGN